MPRLRRTKATNPRLKAENDAVRPSVSIRIEDVTVQTRSTRAYARWVVISLAFTLLVAWLCFPSWFDGRILPVKLTSLSELFFESALFQYIPHPIVGDEFLENLTNIMKPLRMPFGHDGDFKVPGMRLRKLGAHAHHPVLLIPGITSTGLELWEGRACASSYFRQRLWGTLAMLRLLFVDKECWLEHIKLDPATGTDPAGVKLRAAQGLEAADFIFPGFWVWARIIENLALIGYDQNSLQMAPYDWRLDIWQLEVRDRYFTRLKRTIETHFDTGGRKLVIVAHSLGSNIWLYFMKWVEAPADCGGGGGGSQWVDKHIHAFANIAGPLLGLPKTISSIMSGEMRDTAQLGKLESYLLDMLLSKRERAEFFRSLGGLLAMLPKGGHQIWGNGTSIVHDSDPPLKYGLVNFNANTTAGYEPALGPEQTPKLLTSFLSAGFLDRLEQSYSTGVADPKTIERNDRIPKHWMNPLETRLPNAPNMRIYCFYGVGRDTERGYHYIDNPGISEKEDPKTTRMNLDLTVENRTARLYTGIHHADGDGTVPLISTGYLCAHAWPKFAHLNPANITVITREYPHEPLSLVADVRGGPKTSDHVDILGNHELTVDILRIAADFTSSEANPNSGTEHELTNPEAKSEPVLANRIISRIAEIAQRIALFPVNN